MDTGNPSGAEKEFEKRQRITLVAVCCAVLLLVGAVVLVAWFLNR